MALAVPVIGGIFDLGSKLIDRLIPDKTKAAELQIELLKLHQSGDLAQLDADLKREQIQLDRDKAQIEVNKVEAASPDLFRGGWRPFVGWICGLGVAYEFLAQPLLAWASGINGWPVPPRLEMGDLITLLGGMLGLGALRTTERLKGVVAPSK